MALTELGMEPISSFQDEDNVNASQICAQIWDDYARYLLSVYPWRFTMKKQQLGQLADVPINEWLYAFQMPTDLLSLRAIFSDSSAQRATYLGYEIFGDQVYSDSPTLYADYQAYVEPNLWPYWFVQFAVMALAAKLAPILTDKVEIANSKSLLAWGPPQDNLQGGMFGQAKSIDSKQMPVEPITHFELIEARFS